MKETQNVPSQDSEQGIESSAVVNTVTFANIGLNEQIVQGTDALGYVTPTPIQQQAIPVLLSGVKDFIGLAQTGTGKTAAFGLPLLQLIDNSNKKPQALVICPTRELCVQITNEIEGFKKFLPGVFSTAVYGGASITAQMRDLRRGVQIVVATPGRLIDLIERKAINLEEIKYVVLDEADEMLNMGFQDDIEFILKNTPNRNSIWLFSATMPPAIRKVSKTYMNEPVEVMVGKVNTANKSIEHQYYVTSGHQRYETLKRLIDYTPGIYGLIFTRTKMDAQDITEKLTREGYDVDALHGDLNQNQRDKVMNAFRDKTLQLLIATDVAARGIDVTGITHVINYELPDDVEVYTHRSGRTGRAGKTGVCMSVVTGREIGKIRAVERIVQSKFIKSEIPSGTDVCRKQFNGFMDRLLATDISEGAYEPYLPVLMEKFADVSKEEILQKVAATEFDRFLKYYENASDLNVRENRDRNSDRRSVDRFERGNDRRDDRRGDRRDRPERGDRRGMDRGERGDRPERADRGDRQTRDFGNKGNLAKLFVNLGTKDGFYKASFLQFILDMSDLKKEVLGRIDMKDLNSWVEIEKGAANQMIKSLDGKKYKGRSIRMNEA